MQATDTEKPSASHLPNCFVSTADLPQRVRDIATLRGLGYSFREIAGQFDVTPQAVSLMLSRHRRSLQTLATSPDLSQLSARAVNALGRHGVSTRQQARERDVMALLKLERNCGRKTIEEIARWMDESTPPPHDGAAPNT